MVTRNSTFPVTPSTPPSVYPGEPRILEVIPKWECFELLPMAGIGRVALFAQGRVEVFPVNFARLGSDIVFLSGSGTKLHAASENAEVVFQVDHADPMFHTGWSVVARGRLDEVTDDHTLGRVHRLPLSPWAPGDRHHFLRLQVEEVSGRRIIPVHDGRRHRAAPEHDGAPNATTAPLSVHQETEKDHDVD